MIHDRWNDHTSRRGGATSWNSGRLLGAELLLILIPRPRVKGRFVLEIVPFYHLSSP
jgi:hypothetical protein